MLPVILAMKPGNAHPRPCKKRPANHIVRQFVPRSRDKGQALLIVVSAFIRPEPGYLAVHYNPSATPFELLALLLLTAPDELTLQKFVALLP